MPSSTSWTRVALTAFAAVALVAAVSTTAAASSSSSGVRHQLVSIPQGSVASSRQMGSPFGDTDPSTPVDVSIVLRSGRLADLEARVQAGWKGPFLTTNQFAAQYGQSPAVIRSIEQYLGRYGITTSAYADGLDISANGTAGQFDQALNVSLQNFHALEPDATSPQHWHTATVYGSAKDPQLPASVAGPILAILGLSNYSPYVSHAEAAHGHQATATGSTGTGIPAGEGLAPQDFENRYDLAPLERQGSQGQGTTVGIVTLASIDPSTPLAFWNKVLGLHSSPHRLKVITIDGGAGAVSLANGSDETDLDVEQAGAIAPAANIRLYVAPNTDPGFADGFFAAASDNIADTVSVSWGESDTYVREAIANSTEPTTYAEVFDEVFAEFGAQGQSNFTATGDYGAFNALPDAGTSNLDTDIPADSPYTTAAGGTTIPGAQTYDLTDSAGNPTGATESVNIPSERSWGWDYLWPLYQALGEPDETTTATNPDFIGGDDGGFSALEPRPAYQQSVARYNDRRFLTPTDYTEQAPGLVLPTGLAFNPAPSLQAGFSTIGRGIPDISTNADPQTGYALYDPTLVGGDGFIMYGGCSFVAPQLNGAAAVIDSALGHRVGFWNPAIYRDADQRNSPFTPLNDTTVYSGRHYLYQSAANGTVTTLPGEFTNTNLYYTGTPGATWNPASGLGTPDLAALERDFDPSLP